MRRSLLLLCLVALALAIGVRRSMLLIRVAGRSMEPAVPDGSWLLALRMPPTGAVWNVVRALLLRRGVVVVAYQPNSNVVILKRLIGLPGDWQYWLTPNGQMTQQIVPPSMYFLQGDAATAAAAPADSRSYGPLPMSAFIARGVWLIPAAAKTRPKLPPSR